MPWLRVWALPVLPVSWSLEHWMELLPSWVDEESWLRSALSPSCSPSWVTWAMAGMAATASIAKSAANNINFFIPLLPFLSTRQCRASPSTLNCYPDIITQLHSPKHSATIFDDSIKMVLPLTEG